MYCINSHGNKTKPMTTRNLHDCLCVKVDLYRVKETTGKLFKVPLTTLIKREYVKKNRSSRILKGFQNKRCSEINN